MDDTVTIRERVCQWNDIILRSDPVKSCDGRVKTHRFANECIEVRKRVQLVYVRHCSAH